MKTEQSPLGQGELARAIDLVGLSKLAESIGVPYQLIQGWLKPSRRFGAPAEHCPAIERATDRKVICEGLRPDVDWPYLRNSVGLEVPTPGQSTTPAPAAQSEPAKAASEAASQPDQRTATTSCADGIESANPHV